MDAFTQGYITCAPWSSTDNSREDGGDPLDDNYDESDIAPSTLAEIEADCADFQEANAADLTLYEEITGRPSDHAGHDFWLTRNGHGTGFWDRGAGDVGERLTKASKVYGSRDLYVGDDGLIYQD